MSEERSAEEEALLNEYKGNLFEFSVAHHLARSFTIEQVFWNDLGAFGEQLQFYESEVRRIRPQLLKDLAYYAQGVCKELTGLIKFQPAKILLVGKISGGSHKNIWDDADILVLSDSNETFPVSLKLTRAGSFTNTKSGGIKSFITNYFSFYSRSDFSQQELNSFVDREFDLMMGRLLEDEGFSISTNFVKEWERLGLPDRPGKLKDKQQEILHGLYAKVVRQLYHYLVEIASEDRSRFTMSLKRLMGLCDGITQVTCFHEEDRTNYRIKISGALPSHGDDFQLVAPKEGISSFEITYCDIRLQLRVKPMNKFTTAAYKVNCAIKRDE